jgi:hypothetical protein
MTQKTADLQRDVENVELGEDDAQDFMERLDAFRDSLPDREKAILAQMVMHAAGEQPNPPEEKAQQPEPTQEEIDAFTDKLNRFHDELPGEMHLFVDEMLSKTWFKDASEVQGYHWVRISPWQKITNWDRNAYDEWCYSRGGDAVYTIRRPGGTKRFVACFDNTDY